ncbi:MAG: glycosyl transferase [Bdellovibrionales bacterium RIFOXYB1_FULL_37_110]|nr:MAG: glycosyl transferase [Bdellovibrionales bacterium RIFOXYC1_FULL_37_79]OFZ58784.1 MAG: glycosyl transferase [Bdellovibrionales bacterium RIFOXYB1_FULL_37_110]OFZ64783.1 MAG: glycosyl transferase [Bdellovibrionales bacterium RIFOXYD1_FULL_36_51]
MIYNYCTLFNHHYLTRGIAMYESLLKHAENFHLYIICFDTITHDILKSLNLSYVTFITLEEFEDSELRLIKPSRTAGEYCWTCTSSTLLYCIKTYKLDHCTYLDSDLYFFSNPNVLVDEMGGNSVLITSHNYTKKYDQSQTSGRFCVQFLTVKNNSTGMQVLNDWRKNCIKWCFNRVEDGKFGDQKYLDSWPDDYNGIHILKNPGGLAPFNIQQYDLSNPPYKMVFYHFHGLQFIGKHQIDLGYYELNKLVVQTIYAPYLNHLEKIKNKLEQISPLYDYHGTKINPISWKSPLRLLKRSLMGVYNVYNINYFKRI